jgi:hypothetical protein
VLLLCALLASAYGGLFIVIGVGGDNVEGDVISLSSRLGECISSESEKPQHLPRRRRNIMFWGREAESKSVCSSVTLPPFHLKGGGYVGTRIFTLWSYASC